MITALHYDHFKEGSAYIWRLQGSDYINEMGQIKEYTLGPNSIKTNYNYNSNFNLEEIITKKADNTILFNYGYVFDHAKKNLKSRTDNIRTIEEGFTYDNVQRLETIKKNNIQSLSIGYNSNGNIKNKTDAGSYIYLSKRPHAVDTIITNANSMIHTVNQSIPSYNPFHKAATITEGAYSYTITYGTDRQRKKTVLKQNNTTIETKIYSGLYEGIAN